MKIKITKPGVTIEHSVLDVGVTIDVTDAEASHMVACGVAEVVEVPEPEAEPEPKTAGRRTAKK